MIDMQLYSESHSTDQYSTQVDKTTIIENVDNHIFLRAVLSKGVYL